MNDPQSKLVSHLTDLVIGHQADPQLNVAAKPMRFGLGELTFVALLISLHMMFIFNWVHIRAGQGDIIQRALAALFLSAAVVAGPAYLSFRLITEHRIESPLRRILMLLGAEVLTVGMFFMGAFCVSALLRVENALPFVLLGVVAVAVFAFIHKPLDEARDRTKRF